MEQEKNNFYVFKWIQLFILFLIPVAIIVHTVTENNREYTISSSNRAQDIEIGDNQRRNIVLHEYLKTLNDLIEKYGPQLNESRSAPLAARFATLSAFNQLDPDRRRSLFRLLYDTKLIIYNLISDRIPISLKSVNLTNLCLIDGFVEQTLTHISMEGAIMIKADFHGINLEGAIFNRAILTNADFSDTTNDWLCDNDDMACGERNNPSIYFENADLTSASFSRAIYSNVTFTSSKMININLKSFMCESCKFTMANMLRADLQKSEIQKSLLASVILIDVNLYKSTFFQDAAAFGTDMTRINATYTNFTACQFNYAQLKNATFDYAVIVNTTFMKSQMFRISMQYSILIEVNFTDVDLSRGNWRHIQCERYILTRANFTNTDLFNGTFIECDFRNSIITKEQLKQTASLKDSILPNENLI